MRSSICLLVVSLVVYFMIFFFFKQKTAYEMRISDWSSDVCSSDLGAANDRVKICEDTDGDGVADKFTVFADGLNIATSFTFANDGIIVSMAPHFIFLKDTDGDAVADLRDNIMTGWRKNETHAGPSNLKSGFDNKICSVTGNDGFYSSIYGHGLAFGQVGKQL